MKKRRPVLGVVFAVVAAVLFVRSCGAVGADTSAALVAHAAYTGNTVTLTQAQTLALFGNTIEVQYLQAAAGGSNTVQTVNATYLRNESIHAFYNSYYSPEGQNFSGRQVITYQIQTSDLQRIPSQSTIKIKTSVDISDLAYIDTGLISWEIEAGSWNYIPAPLSDTLYGTYNDYWHTSVNTFFPLRRAAEGESDFNYYGVLRSAYSLLWGTIIPCYYNSDSASSFSFGFANANWCAYPDANGNCVFSIVCPILSDNWAYSGNTGAGDYDPNASSGGGSDDGADMSGVESRLDTIISQLDAIYAEMQDDESSGGGSDSVAGLDSTPDNYDFDAAFVAAQDNFQTPPWVVSPENSGSAAPDFTTPATTQAGAANVGDLNLAGGASSIWSLLADLLGAAPWFVPLAIFLLALSIASTFLFRGGS